MVGQHAVATSLTPNCERRSIPLDFTTLPTRDPTSHIRHRIHGMKEAPTYHPTVEEFNDPLNYIRRIRNEAEQYGIAKIIPPKQYRPDFCLDTEVS
jgi:histone demethylase JARID1